MQYTATVYDEKEHAQQEHAVHALSESALSTSRCVHCTRNMPPRRPESLELKGLVEIVPIFHTVFARVYHYAISELCKGLCHHNGV